MNEIELVRESEYPLFYILIKDKEIELNNFGKCKPYKITLEKGDIVPNYYKRNCHIVNKKGKSKGKLIGLHKEYVGFTTVAPLSVETLDDIYNGKIKTIYK